MFLFFAKKDSVKISSDISEVTSSLTSESAPPVAEIVCNTSGETAVRSACIATVQTWQRESDKQCETATWLKYESQANQVIALSYSVCTEFEDKINVAAKTLVEYY